MTAAAAPVHTRATFKYIDPACDGGILYEMQRESSTLVFDPRAMEVLDGYDSGVPLQSAGQTACATTRSQQLAEDWYSRSKLR